LLPETFAAKFHCGGDKKAAIVTYRDETRPYGMLVASQVNSGHGHPLSIRHVRAMGNSAEQDGEEKGWIDRSLSFLPFAWY
jgi:hypothetical protein